MEKRVLGRGFGVFIILAIFALFSGFVLAEDTEQQKIDKAYTCLNSEINNRSSLTFEQAIFSALAVGPTKASDKIKSEKSSSECWPKDGCRLKETAQAVLALRRMGQDTSASEKWLFTRNATPTDFIWYLEIDVTDRTAATCTIKYNGNSGTVKVKEDMTLSGSTAGDCFTISSSNYWMKIIPKCLDNEFEISCDKDFVTALVYEKKTGSTVYVSSEAHKSSANGNTKENVKARCFKTGDFCDYEGSLWSAYVLNKAGYDVNAFVPYLSAFAEDNTKYFPSAMLFSLLGSSANSEFYSDIVQRQNSKGIWEISGSLYKKYYDTSLALLGLTSTKTDKLDELTRAKTALLASQRSDGCWSERDAIVDTGFLLYSGWQRAVSGGTGGGTSVNTRCDIVNGQSCENKIDCTDAGGQERTGFDCAGGNICCSVKVVQKACSALNGALCGEDEECSEIEMPSSDGSCCTASCIKKAVTETYTCADSGGECKPACGSSETEDSSKTCSGTSSLCCIKQEAKTSWTWIIILIILIILIVIGIIYRDKLRVWWYKFKGKARISPVVKPGVPPMSRFSEEFKPSPKFAPSPSRPAPRPVFSRAPSPRDKEMEDTLKKLKEMSK